MLQDMVVGDAAESIALVHVAPCIGFLQMLQDIFGFG